MLGKELLVLAWAVEKAGESQVPNAVRNWIGLKPEERWWLFTATAAATGLPQDADIGWRKALRFAFTENPLAEPLPDIKRAIVKERKVGKSAAVSETLLLFRPDEEESIFLTAGMSKETR